MALQYVLPRIIIGSTHNETEFITILDTGSPNHEHIVLQLTIGTPYLFNWKSRGSDSIDVDAHQFVPVFSACIMVTLAMF